MKTLNILIYIILSVFFLSCTESYYHKEKEFNTIIKGNADSLTVFQYEITDSAHILKQELKYITKAKFEEDGEIERTIILDGNHNFLYSISYFKDGKDTDIVRYYSGELEFTTQHMTRKDKKNRQLWIKRYQHSGTDSIEEPIGSTVIKADTIYFTFTKNAISKHIKHHKGFEYDESVYFDEKGNIIEENLFNNGSRQNNIYEYDSNGFVTKLTIEMKNTNDDSSQTDTYTFKYKTDEKGNWTEQTTFEARGIPVILIKRKIFYK